MFPNLFVSQAAFSGDILGGNAVKRTSTKVCGQGMSPEPGKAGDWGEVSPLEWEQLGEGFGKFGQLTRMQGNLLVFALK